MSRLLVLAWLATFPFWPSPHRCELKHRHRPHLARAYRPARTLRGK